MQGSFKIRKRILAFLFAGITAISCTGCMTKSETVTHTVEVPPDLIFLGDSIPAGYGLEGYTSTDNYSCQSYPNILGEKYTAELSNECESSMKNVAVSGETSAQLLGHLQNGEFDDTLKNSDAIVISIGGNDILQIFEDFIVNDLGINDSGLSDWASGDINIFTAMNALGDLDDRIDNALDGYEPNLEQIIAEIKSKTKGEIFVQTLYNPFEYYEKLSFLVDFSDEKIGILNDIITENSTAEDGEENYTVIDVAAEFKGKCGDLTTIKSLDIHPNADGHKVIAEVVDSSLREKNYTYYTVEEVTDYQRIVLTVCCCVLGGSVLLIILWKLVRSHRKSNKEK